MKKRAAEIRLKFYLEIYVKISNFEIVSLDCILKRINILGYN